MEGKIIEFIQQLTPDKMIQYGMGGLGIGILGFLSLKRMGANLTSILNQICTGDAKGNWTAGDVIRNRNK